MLPSGQAKRTQGAYISVESLLAVSRSSAGIHRYSYNYSTAKSCQLRCLASSISSTRSVKHVTWRFLLFNVCVTSTRPFDSRNTKSCKLDATSQAPYKYLEYKELDLKRPECLKYICHRKGLEL